MFVVVEFAAAAAVHAVQALELAEVPKMIRSRVFEVGCRYRRLKLSIVYHSYLSPSLDAVQLPLPPGPAPGLWQRRHLRRPPAQVLRRRALHELPRRLLPDV